MTAVVCPIRNQPQNIKKYSLAHGCQCNGSESTFDINTSTDRSGCGYSEVLDIDWNLVSAYKSLLNMYSLQVNEHLIDGQPIVSGGLQQYLIREGMHKQPELCDQPTKGNGSEHTTFHDLPVNITFMRQNLWLIVNKFLKNWFSHR